MQNNPSIFEESANRQNQSADQRFQAFRKACVGKGGASSGFAGRLESSQKSLLNCSSLKIIGKDLYDPYRFLADIIGLGIVFPEKKISKNGLNNTLL